jgi:CNT family concentrative nucleoside transporter
MGLIVTLLRGLLGLATLVGIAYLFSSDRRQINWRLVGIGIGLQVVFALIVLKTGPGFAFFEFIGGLFAGLLRFAEVGADFVFQSFVTGQTEVALLNFAFRVLPTIIFFAALMGLLYHLKIIQPLVRGMGWFMGRTMGLSGAESLSAAANVFIGQTEAPLVIRPYVPGMTSSELMTLMVGGFATIAGSVLAVYIAMLGGTDPAAQARFAAHLLSASIMSAPAAIVIAKVLVPETGTPATVGVYDLHDAPTNANVIEATAGGAADGLKLAANVGAMLLAFIAILGMINAMLGWIGAPTLFGTQLYDLNGAIVASTDGGFSGLSLQSILGYVFAPLSWLMGVESGDILQFGRLMGEKLVLTELIAYDSLSKLEGVVSDRTVVMGTYALCGFANFGSIAIQIGGIGGIAPGRRSDIARLGLRAMIGGALASWMTATIAGVLI